MIKKYKLLKDLPDLKAGIIFETIDDYGYFYQNDSGDKSHFYSKYTIENTPGWFEPIGNSSNKCTDLEYEILEIIKKINYVREVFPMDDFNSSHYSIIASNHLFVSARELGLCLKLLKDIEKSVLEFSGVKIRKMED